MSSLVRLNSNRMIAYLKWNEIPSSVSRKTTRSGFGLELGGVEARKGEDAVSSVAPNQSVSFDLGKLESIYYNGLIEVHPSLHANGIVSAPRIIEPGEPAHLLINFQAKKQITLDLPWIVRVYLID